MQFLVILCLMIIVQVQWSRRLLFSLYFHSLLLSQFSFIFHTPVLLFFYTVQFFFFLHSSFHNSVFFFHVCFDDRSRKRTKESKLYQGLEWGRCEVLFSHIVYWQIILVHLWISQQYWFLAILHIVWCFPETKINNMPSYCYKKIICALFGRKIQLLKGMVG